MTFYTALLCTYYSYGPEKSYLYFRTQCKYHLFHERLSNSSSPSDLLLYPSTPEDFEYSFKAYTRYLMTCDLITYLHIFLFTWLGEPWGQECIPSCLEHTGLEKQFTKFL